MKRPDLRGVLFDLDNTLYDRDLAFATWARAFVDEHFADSDDRRHAAVARLVALDAGGYCPRPALFARVKTLYPSLPYDPDALCFLFHARWLDHAALDAGACRLLDGLDAAGIPFGIVTNGGVHQGHKVERLGLGGRARCVLISEVFGASKPDPAIFLAAAATLGLPCRHVLFVGDNPAADICGAKAAGMSAAWLHRGSAWPDDPSGVAPDYRVASLAELLPLLPPVPLAPPPAARLRPDPDSVGCFKE